MKVSPARCTSHQHAWSFYFHLFHFYWLVGFFRSTKSKKKKKGKKYLSDEFATHQTDKLKPPPQSTGILIAFLFSLSWAVVTFKPLLYSMFPLNNRNRKKLSVNLFHEIPKINFVFMNLYLVSFNIWGDGWWFWGPWRRQRNTEKAR